MTDAATSGAALHRLTITSDGARHELHLDGQDLTDSLRGIEVVLEAGTPPVVVLHPAPARAMPAVLDVLARVHVGEDDPGPAAARFIARIDPGELERAALNRMDLGSGPHSLTEAMMRQLTEWATGHAR
ncbi:hypothetical protein [Embleya sp. NPDC059237]|uniref:hypothetical protein n=1 Tax=Embleya sp. NPDC059237 TaxID=3346784 RepID=UPI00369C6A7E